MITSKQWIFLLFLLPLSMISAGQSENFRLNDLPLNDLSGFRQPGTNWKITGPLTASYTDTVFGSSPGTGVLLNQYSRAIQFKPDANLFTAFEHGDIYLELEFNMPKGSNSGVYFQSRYEIQLFDSWGKLNPSAADCGGIYERWDESRPAGSKGYEGHPPMKNAAFAPGVWQKLQVSFQAPKFDGAGKKISNAKFLFVKLNGVTIHENIVLTGPTRAAAFEDEKATGPLMIQGDHGMVAFRNIRYAPQNELKVGIKNLTYSYTEGKFDSETDALKAKPTRKGKADLLDSRLADARNEYFLSFEGTMTVPETDNYFFSMLYSGNASLVIDGKTVIPLEWNWIGASPKTGSAQLSQGDHNFKLTVNKQVNWAQPGLSLHVQKPNTRMVPLHSPSSMPERVPAPLIQVVPARNPELVRSFMFQGNKKLTHVISMGSPQQVNYAYNLLQGGLLKIWKGNFLNTTDMWHERGEPQTASPLGSTITLTGKSPVSPDQQSAPDSLAGIVYRGYTLNAERYPVFQYEYGGAKFTDGILPWENGRGLMREISVSSGSLPSTTGFPVAEGKLIRDLGNNLFAINDQQFYVRILPGNNQSVSIKNTANGQVLMLTTKDPNVRYVYIW